MKTVEQMLFEMLTECTGVALCDSGGAYGRNWQRNQKKTLADFQSEPEVTFDTDEEDNVGVFDYTISVFHYLRQQLELDEICQGFNRRNVKADNWDDDRFCGVSASAGKYLDRYNVKVQGTFNSYNGPDHLSQVIQGTYCRIADNGYVLLQIHGGCDVRGGYTNARLFRVLSDYADGEYTWLCPQDVYGMFTPNNVDLKTPSLPGINTDIAVAAGVVRFDNRYDGETLTYDQDAQNANTPIELNVNQGKVEMFLCIC